MNRQECRNCRWYDQVDDYCAQLEFYVHANDGKECEEFMNYQRRKQEDGHYAETSGKWVQNA